MDRLRAEDDLRQINLLAAVTNQEAYAKTVAQLNKTLGQISVFEESRRELVLTEDGFDPEFDRDGYAALRAKFSRKLRQ